MRRWALADRPLVGLALLLSAVGVAMVHSAGVTDVPVAFVAGAWKRQLAWLVVALGASWAATRASPRLLEWLAWPAYLAGLALLGLTLVIGTGAGTAASMKGWIAIGGVRIGQPSELAKLTTALMLARSLAAAPGPPRGLLDLWRPVAVALAPSLLVMLQPDLGSALVFVGLLFAMLFWAGTPWPTVVLLASPAVSLLLAFSTGLWGAWFLALLALVWWVRPWVTESAVVVAANLAMGVVAPLLWDRLAPYQQRRLLVFLDPSRDPRASGYHVIQSRVAIGSGGWFGKGYTHGTQKRLAFLPAQHTDFIYSVLGEELGFLGVAATLALFLLFFRRVLQVATRASDAFSSLVAFGLGAGLFVHVVVNVGMTLNLMPITGIPLPFFSYGGSFMLACWLAVGLVSRVGAEGRGAGRLAPSGRRP